MPMLASLKAIPDKYGEDTEKSVCLLMRSRRVIYENARDKHIASLKKQYYPAMSASDSYKYLLQDIADFKKHIEKSVTLNEKGAEKSAMKMRKQL
jgi:carboxyl-terminal processing protease